MRTPFALLAAATLLLTACDETTPIYMGDRQIGTVGTLGGGAGSGTPSATDECYNLALRAADPSLTDAQRRAAAEYRASLGC